MRVLFVTLGAPFPPDRGNRQRDYNLIRYVARHHSVSLLCLLGPDEDAAVLRHFDPFCDVVDSACLSPRSLREHFSQAAAHLRGGWPIATYPFFRDEMARKILRAVTRLGVDIVHVEHSFMARYVEAVPRRSGAKTVLCFHNVGAEQYRRMLRMRLGPAGRAVALLKWLLMIGWEARCAARFDRSIVVSEAERELLHRDDPRLPVTVIENGVDTRELQPLPESPREDTLLFVGTFTYQPNVDAARYFCGSVLPLIRRQVSGVRAVLVGHEPPPSVRRLAESPAVVVAGSVPDLTPYYGEATVCVVPLRAGGGTRLKILEAMALGRAVVTTTLGAEGLDLRDGEHLLLADTPHQFAEAVVRLLRDRPLRRSLVTNARARAETEWDWSTIGDKLVRTYAQLVTQPTGQTRDDASGLHRATADLP